MSLYSQFVPGASRIAKDGVVIAELLVVGGGGTAPNFTYDGNARATGGGGAGEYIYVTGVRILTGTSLAIVVGGSQSQSSFGSLVAAAGQKGGDVNESLPGSQLGSGGGAGDNGSAGSISARTTTEREYVMNFPTEIRYIDLRSRYPGGGASASASGGGGGAGGAGGNASPGVAGAAGVGLSNSITGTSVTYAAGGAGAVETTITNGANGAANTGNGGGGCSRNTAGTSTGGLGGSGVVILAYPDIYAEPASITGTYDQPSRTGWRVYRFTSSGSITL